MKNVLADGRGGCVADGSAGQTPQLNTDAIFNLKYTWGKRAVSARISERL